MKMMQSVGRLALVLALLVPSMIVPAHEAAALTSARAVTANFSTAVGSGNAIVLKNGEQITYKVLAGAAGTQAVTAVLEKSCDGSNFGGLSVAVSTSANYGTYTATIPVESCAGGKVWMRFRASAYTSGASSTTITEVDNVVSSLYNNANESVADVLDGGLAANGYVKVLGGPLNPYQRTKAQLVLIVPAVGDVYTCSDCTHPYTLVIATGSAVDQFRESGLTTGVQ